MVACYILAKCASFEVETISYVCPAKSKLQLDDNDSLIGLGVACSKDSKRTFSIASREVINMSYRKAALIQEFDESLGEQTGNTNWWTVWGRKRTN